MYEREKSPTFQMSKAQKRAYDALVPNRERVEIESFAGQYGEEEIRKDARTVRDLKDKFEEQDTEEEKELERLSELFETLVSQLAELEQWFGENTFVNNTSEFDDIENGVDLTVEFLKEGYFSHMGLAVDVTFSKKSIEKKLRRIRDEIKKGQLAEVKYFSSGKGGFQGQLNNIPRVVIKTDEKTIDTLADLWIRRGNLRKLKFSKELTREARESIGQELKEVNQQLREHDIQIDILRQIDLQLTEFAKFAEQEGKSNLKEKLDASSGIIQGILSEKDFGQADSESTIKLKESLDRIFNPGL